MEKRKKKLRKHRYSVVTKNGFRNPLQN